MQIKINKLKQTVRENKQKVQNKARSPFCIGQLHLTMWPALVCG